MTTKKLVLKHILASLCFLTSGLLAGDIVPSKEMDSVPNEVQRMFLEHMSRKQRKGVARVGSIWNFLAKTFDKIPADFPEERWKIGGVINITNESDSLEKAIKTLADDPLKIFRVNLSTPLSNYDVLNFANARSIVLDGWKNFDEKQLEVLQRALKSKSDWWEFGLFSAKEYGPAGHYHYALWFGTREDMTEKHLEFLSPLLKNRYLAALEIDFFKFSAGTLEQLLELLHNKPLHFSLSACGLGMLFGSDEKIKILSDWLAKNPPILTLGLMENKLTDEDITLLGDALKKSEFLTDLDLQKNDITALSMANIINVINNSDSNITTLNFSRNLVGNTFKNTDDVSLFINALKENKKVKFLDFSYCLFPTPPYPIDRLLIEALEKSTIPISINLEGSNVSDAVKLKIEQIFWEKTLLERLKERETEID